MTERDHRAELYRTVPELSIPETPQIWKQQRSEIQQTLKQLLGELPPAPETPAAHLISRDELPEGTVERLLLDGGSGVQIPAIMLLPSRPSGPVPAILYCHQHGGAYDVGKEELLREAPIPVCPGRELLRAGFAVLAIDAPGFGERSGQGPEGPEQRGGEEELSRSKWLLWQGMTLWGMMVRDDQIGLDYLCSRPEIDSARIGVTGFSMGSTRSWWLAALDDRIACVSGVACLTRYQELIAAHALHAHGIYYFVPGMLRHFDTEAVVSLIAPRPLLLQLGDQDEGSPADGARRILEKTGEIYKLLDAPEQLRDVIYPGIGHSYTPAMWAETLSWFQRYLQA